MCVKTVHVSMLLVPNVALKKYSSELNVHVLWPINVIYRYCITSKSKTHLLCKIYLHIMVTALGVVKQQNKAVTKVPGCT